VQVDIFSELVITSADFREISRNSGLKTSQNSKINTRIYFGDRETWKHGDTDMETWRHGDMKTWKHGDMDTWTHGDTETWRDRDMDTWTHGDTETWRHGDKLSSLFVSQTLKNVLTKF
jgi:hypothetical protein